MDVDIKDQRDQNYIKPKPRIVAFSGAGRALGRYVCTCSVQVVCVCVCCAGGVCAGGVCVCVGTAAELQLNRTGLADFKDG